MVAFSQLLAIVLIAVVILFVAPAKHLIASTADNTLKVFGIDIGKPSIASFTATLSSDGGVLFSVSIGGNRNDVVLEIYWAKASEDKAATVLEAPNANYSSDHLVYTSSTDEVEAVFSVECPGQDKCCRIKSVQPNCITAKLAPDWYRFSAVLKKKEKTVDVKDALLGVYTESYVELLNKPITGCKDSEFWNCNVIECKKELINTNLLDPLNILEFRRDSGILWKISKEFTDEKATEPGFDVASNCGKVGDVFGNVITNTKDRKAQYFVLTGCRDKDIDDLNVKVARVRMLESAYEDTGQTVKSEAQYKDPKYTGRISFWVDQAVRMTMSCTRPLGWSNAPKGAYSQLAKLGWVPWPPTGDFAVWKQRAIDVLSAI